MIPDTAPSYTFLDNEVHTAQEFFHFLITSSTTNDSLTPSTSPTTTDSMYPSPSNASYSSPLISADGSSTVSSSATPYLLLLIELWLVIIMVSSITFIKLIYTLNLLLLSFEITYMPSKILTGCKPCKMNFKLLFLIKHGFLCLVLQILMLLIAYGCLKRGNIHTCR